MSHVVVYKILDLVVFGIVALIFLGFSLVLLACGVIEWFDARYGKTNRDRRRKE